MPLSLNLYRRQANDANSVSLITSTSTDSSGTGLAGSYTSYLSTAPAGLSFANNAASVYNLFSSAAVATYSSSFLLYACPSGRIAKITFNNTAVAEFLNLMSVSMYLGISYALNASVRIQYQKTSSYIGPSLSIYFQGGISHLLGNSNAYSLVYGSYNSRFSLTSRIFQTAVSTTNVAASLANLILGSPSYLGTATSTSSFSITSSGSFNIITLASISSATTTYLSSSLNTSSFFYLQAGESVALFLSGVYSYDVSGSYRISMTPGNIGTQAANIAGSGWPAADGTSYSAVSYIISQSYKFIPSLNVVTSYSTKEGISFITIEESST